MRMAEADREVSAHCHAGGMSRRLAGVGHDNVPFLRW